LHDKDLAQRVLDVSQKLESATTNHKPSHINMPLSDKISLEDQAQAHLKLAKEWYHLLHTIHTTLPGFQDFLQPPSVWSLMQSLPNSGPIVVINVHESRCDAIALIAGLDEPFHICLPNFSLAKAAACQQRLTGHLKDHQLCMQSVE
jgi:hypothetical protein